MSGVSQSLREGISAAQARQFDRARPLLEQATSADPGNYDLRLMYAHALRDKRQFPAAAAQFYADAIKEGYFVV